jgi:hypothetical protein
MPEASPATFVRALYPGKKFLLDAGITNVIQVGLQT